MKSEVFTQRRRPVLALVNFIFVVYRVSLSRIWLSLRRRKARPRPPADVAWGLLFYPPFPFPSRYPPFHFPSPPSERRRGLWEVTLSPPRCFVPTFVF